MSVSVVIYLDPDRPPQASLNTGNPKPFAVIDLVSYPGNTYIALKTVADCDAMIKAAVAAKDLLLAAQHPAQCQSCGATTTELDPVHVRATTGIAARTEHYCHDTKACNERRHPALAGTIAAVARPARPKNSGGTT